MALTLRSYGATTFSVTTISSKERLHNGVRWEGYLSGSSVCHLAARVGDHEVNLGLVRDHLEGWDYVLGDSILLLLHHRPPLFGVSLSASELPP